MNDRQAFETIRYRSRDGLSLAVRDYGGPTASGLPVVCLPGLTRSTRDFHALALDLSQDRRPTHRVVSFDYRGRGDSERDPTWTNYAPAIEAADVLAGLAALGIGRAVLVGTSRGGILAMLMATMQPGLLAAAVLNDIGPVVEAAGLFRIKQVIAVMDDPTDWDDAVRRLLAAYGSVFPAFDEADWHSFARTTYRDVEGHPRVDFDPAIARTLDPVTPEQSLPSLWPQFAAMADVPVLVLRGEHSDILSRQTLLAMADRHPHLEQLTVAGQGHPPQLWRRDLIDRISQFIAARAEAEAH